MKSNPVIPTYSITVGVGHGACTLHNIMVVDEFITVVDDPVPDPMHINW